MNDFKGYFPIIFKLLIAVAFMFSCWYIGKWINYKFSYNAQVQKTVCQMIKPEALVEPCN